MSRNGAVIIFGYECTLKEDGLWIDKTHIHPMDDMFDDLPEEIDGLELIANEEGDQILLGHLMYRMEYSDTPREIDGVDTFYSQKINNFHQLYKQLYPRVLLAIVGD